MDDLISRKALLEAYDKAHQGTPGMARKLIAEAPEAVVRCKNCVYWIPGKLKCLINFGKWAADDCCSKRKT